jgi:hypothetical protein
MDTCEGCEVASLAAQVVRLKLLIANGSYLVLVALHEDGTNQQRILARRWAELATSVIAEVYDGKNSDHS